MYDSQGGQQPLQALQLLGERHVRPVAVAVDQCQWPMVALLGRGTEDAQCWSDADPRGDQQPAAYTGLVAYHLTVRAVHQDLGPDRQPCERRAEVPERLDGERGPLGP